MNLLPIFMTVIRFARRWLIALAGISVVLVGVAMIVLPGPAIVVIPLGLGILGLEFAWARRWLAAVQRKTSETLGREKQAGKARGRT